jgi:hypothetical protein
LATEFITYQTPGSNPSPPFPEYTSGYTGFSAAAAEILKLFTGSDVYGDSITFLPGSSCFEPEFTPVNSVTLSWDTFTDAADEAGISPCYGGKVVNTPLLKGLRFNLLNLITLWRI